MAAVPPRFDLPDPDMVEVYRAMSPGRRVQAGLSATELIRARLGAHLAETNPEWSQAELEAALAGRLLGECG